MSTLVTGVAGFIGMHTAKSLLSKGHRVVGIDNLNHYYDPRLKKARLTQLESFDKFSFLKTDFARDRAIPHSVAPPLTPKW